MRTRLPILLMTATLVGLTVGHAAAQSACTSLKYKFAGKAALARAKCEAIAAKNGTSTDAACLSKADATLAKKWIKAESKGDCVELGDLAATQAAVDEFVIALNAALEPSPSPTPTPGGNVCCDTGNSCWHGTDAAGCTSLGGTAGAPGTVCDGGTGSCQPSPAGVGQCCHHPTVSICEGGPSIDLAGCASAGGLDFPFVSTCEPDGSCMFHGP